MERRKEKTNCLMTMTMKKLKISRRRNFQLRNKKSKVVQKKKTRLMIDIKIETRIWIRKKPSNSKIICSQTNRCNTNKLINMNPIHICRKTINNKIYRCLFHLWTIKTSLILIIELLLHLWDNHSMTIMMIYKKMSTTWT